MATIRQLHPAVGIAVVLLVLAPAHAAVTSVRIAKIVPGVQGPAGVVRTDDNIECKEDQATKEYTCYPSCVTTTSGIDTLLESFCPVGLQTACDGTWCSMKVSVMAELDVSPSSTTPRISVSANPIYFTKLLTSSPVVNTSTRPYRATWTFQVGTAAAVPTININPAQEPAVRQYTTFFTVSQGRGSGMTTSVHMGCGSLTDAKATFSTPQVDCKGLAVKSASVATGCPALFDGADQGAHLGIFSGSVAGTTTTTQPLDEYHSSGGQAGPSMVLATTAAGRLHATIKKSGFSQSSDAPLQGQTTLRLGHRLTPTTPWNLAPGSVSYVDADQDGFGSTCDCDDADAEVHTGCAKRLAARRMLHN